MPPPAHPEAAISISPKPPRACRTGIAFCVSFAGERAAVIVRASLARTPLQPHLSPDRGTQDIDAQGVVRAAM
jgi:hypothetical protein